jgi:hypothetical protein
MASLDNTALVISEEPRIKLLPQRQPMNTREIDCCGTIGYAEYRGSCTDQLWPRATPLCRE